MVVAAGGLSIEQPRRSTGQAGFTYLGVLFVIALIGISLIAISEVWATTGRRQKLDELDWVGAQYQQAIGSYYDATPGVVVKTYPRTLDHLLSDPRYVTTRRHLRQIYPNPFSANAEWEVIRAADGGIRGVRAMLPMGSEVIGREFVHQRDLAAQKTVGRP